MGRLGDLWSDIEWHLVWRWRVPWPLIAILACAAILAAWLLMPAPAPRRPVIASLAVSVEGSGTVLVNGSSVPLLTREAPFTVALEAVPDRRWVFSRWLVNGSAVGGNPLTLTVGGNTTVVAVFEPVRLCKLRIVGPEGLGFLLNGTPHTAPYEGEYPCGSVLAVLVKYDIGAGELYEIALNESLTWDLDACRLVVEGNETAVVYINGTEYPGFEGYVRRGSVLFLNGSDIPLSESHVWALVGWEVDGEPVYGRSFWLKVERDTHARPVYKLAKREWPPIVGEVLTPNGTVEVLVVPGAPYMLPIFPFSGEYEYLGNGTFRIVADPYALVYIALPKGWEEVRIEVLKYERFDPRFHEADFEIVLSNDEVYLAKGFGLLPGAERYEIAFRFDPEVGPKSYQGECGGAYCSPCWTGPSKKTDPGIEVGWLRVSMFNAEVVFQVKVVP